MITIYLHKVPKIELVLKICKPAQFKIQYCQKSNEKTIEQESPKADPTCALMHPKKPQKFCFVF